MTLGMADSPLLIAKNIHEKPRYVTHAKLKKEGDNSPFRVICPVCDCGVLLVRRDPILFHLTGDDSCTHCGQFFIYDDEEIAGEPLPRHNPAVKKVLDQAEMQTAWDRFLGNDPTK